MMDREPLSHVECIEHVLFDTTTLAADATRFFVTPLGASGKTPEDTNLYSPSSLPAPWSFLVEAIWLACLDEDYPVRLLRDGRFVFFIGSKMYFERSPLGVMYAPLNVVDSMPDNLKTPLLLTPRQDFHAEIVFTNPGTVKRRRFQCRMRGKLYRPA